jgi:hypothetical protein
MLAWDCTACERRFPNLLGRKVAVRPLMHGGPLADPVLGRSLSNLKSWQVLGATTGTPGLGHRPPEAHLACREESGRNPGSRRGVDPWVDAVSAAARFATSLQTGSIWVRSHTRAPRIQVGTPGSARERRLAQLAFLAPDSAGHSGCVDHFLSFGLGSNLLGRAACAAAGFVPVDSGLKQASEFL